MTLMNTEPAAASHARLWPNARGAVSRSLLRAGIASAAAGLFLVLICGLAYANTSAGLSVNVVPSGSPPTANFVANFNDVHQTIDGFGAADAFVGAIPSAAIDSLYCVNATDPGCSNPGIGLTILRQSSGRNEYPIQRRGGSGAGRQGMGDSMGNFEPGRFLYLPSVSPKYCEFGVCADLRRHSDICRRDAERAGLWLQWWQCVVGVGNGGLRGCPGSDGAFPVAIRKAHIARSRF